MDQVRWGFIGVGKHLTTRIIPPLMNSTLVDICGIASRNPEKAQKLSQQCGAEAYSPYEAILADTSIEAVFISLPNHLHLEWIRKAADAGKHILCEKPIAMNAEEAQEAFEYTRDKNVRLMEAFMYRFHPQWITAKELVSSGKIGTLKQVHTYFCYNNMDPENIRNKLDTGGGALYDIGCYAVSVARFMFGAEPKRVMGLFSRDSAFGTDTLISGIMDFEEGHGAFTAGTQASPYQKVEILGTEGRIVLTPPFNVPNDVPAQVELVDESGTQDIMCDAVDQYRLQFEEFSAFLREGGAIPIPSEDAIGNMKAIDALFRSEKSGEWEEVS